MPLNPNGKVDKPALPFPDTVEAASAPGPSKSDKLNASLKLSPTESSVSAIWSKLLPSPPTEIPIDESFFDLGGHSILATRLIFELRKTFLVDAPLGLVFEQPTIKGLAKGIDTLRDPNFGLAQEPRANGQAIPSAPLPSANGSVPLTAALSDDYATDFDLLRKQLTVQYSSPAWSRLSAGTIFLTGATGFLGAYILRDLLARSTSQVAKVICLVRAKSFADAIDRLRSSSLDRGVWDEKWVTDGRLEAVVGDLSEAKFGLTMAEWEKIATTTDVVLHNGAMVSCSCAGFLLQVMLIQQYRCTGSTHIVNFEPRM
jgi:L-aminoadipate-semialdehyde dehydrogenase